MSAQQQALPFVRHLHQADHNMKWEDLKSNVYHEDGSLRDIYIRNVTLDDWRRWIDYINSNHQVEFKIGSTLQGNRIDLDLVTAYWKDAEQEGLSASINLGDIIVNCFFFDKYEIENDITPKEIKLLEDHEKLLEYLKSISILLGMRVELTEENCRDAREVLIEVEGEKVAFPNL